MVLAVIGALERFRRHLEARFDVVGDADRLAAGEHGHVGIAHPVGRRDDHFVAGIERRDEGVVEDLLAAGADDDLARLVVEAVLALELARDRRLELRNAVDRGVFGRLAALDRLDRGALDVSGVSKSGSPAPSPMTSRPAALSARALSVTAMVADGLMRLRDCASSAMSNLRLPGSRCFVVGACVRDKGRCGKIMPPWINRIASRDLIRRCSAWTTRCAPWRAWIA